MKAETFKDRIAIVGNNLKSAREENAKLVHENLELKSQLKEERDKLNEIDHADYCMCRYCAPEFHKLKTQTKQDETKG